MEDVIGGIALAVCIVPLAVASYGIWMRTVSRDRLIQGIVATPGFTPTLRYVADNASVALALDTHSHRLLIVRAKAEPHLIDLRNVVGVEVERVRESPAKTIRRDRTFGAVVRRWWRVPWRVLVRGATDASDSEVKWSKLALRILTSDKHRPMEEIVFYAGPAVASSDVKVSVRLKHCEDWHARLQQILAEGAQQDRAASEV
jgi:hypothetical protein